MQFSARKLNGSRVLQERQNSPARLPPFFLSRRAITINPLAVRSVSQTIRIRDVPSRSRLRINSSLRMEPEEILMRLHGIRRKDREERSMGIRGESNRWHCRGSW